MKLYAPLSLLVTALLTFACASNPDDSQGESGEKEPASLKEAFADNFLIGTALNTRQVSGSLPADTVLVIEQFNSVVAENCMKIEEVHPEPGVYDFSQADAFVAFGERHGMFVIGHTLVWHSQCPDWMFENEDGTTCSRDTLIARMKDHIQTVVTRYKGRVQGWDVVNEAISDQGGLRDSKWRQIIGDDFIELAFRFAHEADPEAELYYNDYSMVNPLKRKEAVSIVQNLKEKGVRIDGVGMQGHYGIDYPDLKEFEKSISSFADLGVKVMITELDVSVLPFPTDEISAEISQNFELKAEYNPYPDGLPDSVSVGLAQDYADLFEVMLRYEDKISRVTFWGVNDARTWRNNWPVRGRTDYPLPFDRDNKPKAVFDTLIDLAARHHR